MECRLEVLIATYGGAGLKRLADKAVLPCVDGVRYVVSVQTGDESDVDVPEALGARKDMSIFKTSGRGLSANRNALLDMAAAPYLLIADDDVIYSEEALRLIIHTFDKNPDVDVAAFKTKEGGRYPAKQKVLSYSPYRKAFYPESREIALRLASVEKTGVRFDTRFGINGDMYCLGEENVFLYDIWRRGAKIVFFPVEVVSHPHSTTIQRISASASMPSRKAVLRHIYGSRAWPRVARIQICNLCRKLLNLR